MLLLDRQSAASPQPRGAGGVHLRLRADGKLIELPLDKTTIGSSPKCNVRIQEPGVQPLHCLIDCSASGLKVRSWASNTKLNGQPFQESTLKEGDCLTIGPVELDVVGPRAAASPAPAVEVETSPPSAPDAGRLRVGRDLARSRNQKLLAALRRERSVGQGLQKQVGDLQETVLQALEDGTSASGKLDGVLAELDSARQRLAEQESIVAEHNGLRGLYEQRERELRELSDRVRQLTNDHAALSEQHRQLTEEKSRVEADAVRIANERDATSEENRRLSDECTQLQNNALLLGNEKAATEEQIRQLVDEKCQLQNQVADLTTQLTNEKAALEEQGRRLNDEKSQLQNEVGELTTQLASQKADFYNERDELRRRNEELQSETRSLAAERTAIADERTALYQERIELRQHVEDLHARIAQLNEESSAMAVAKLTVIEEHDTLGHQNQQLQARVAELSQENLELAAAKSALSEEQDRLRKEVERLADLEREMQTAVAGRENTSAELYRALLQLAELQDRDDQNRANIAAHDGLVSERDQRVREAEELKQQVARQADERASIESAWQALRDEADALSESQQRLTEDNAKLLADMEQLRQQFETTQQANTALTGSVTEMQGELAARREAEATAAAAAAEFERQLSLQANEYAESLTKLEQQLATAHEMQQSLHQARGEWQRQLAEAEQQSAKQLRRIQELEAQVAATQEAASGFSWSTARDGARDHKVENASDGEDSFAESPADELKSDDSPWGAPTASPVEWRTMSARAETPSPEVEGTDAGERRSSEWFKSAEAGSETAGSTAWGRSATESPIEDDSFSGFGGSSEPQPNAAGWSAGLAAGSRAETTANAAKASAWDRETERARSTPFEAAHQTLEETASLSPAPEAAPGKTTQAASFIERYSHLFADDDAAPEENAVAKPASPGVTTTLKPASRGTLPPSGAESTPASSDEEESVEQYIAKLLQRVRGDSRCGAAESVQAKLMPLNAPGVRSHVGSPFRPAPLTSPAAFDDACATKVPVEIEQPKKRESPKRRDPAPSPATDLGALRALANETARRAISRHELHRHRRDAVTKVTVSTLAGVTSLWMMLDSPGWRDIQFITGCVSLIVAAIWAGETLRALLQSLRAAAYDGPEMGPDEVEVAPPPALPIDVDAADKQPPNLQAPVVSEMDSSSKGPGESPAME